MKIQDALINLAACAIFGLAGYAIFYLFFSVVFRQDF